MGQRGPQAKPDWLKVIDGNPGKRPIGKTVQAPTVSHLSPPAHFNDEQKTIWSKLCSILVQVNALSFADEFVLMRYVELMHEYRKAANWMANESKGQVFYPLRDKNNVVKSLRTLPQLKAMLEISNHLLRIEQHLGLTPAARASIIPKGPNGGAEFDIDPFD